VLKIRIKKTRKIQILSDRILRRIIRKTLKSQKITEGEISLLITGDVRIKALNYKYLNKRRPTDVLAFSFREGKPIKGSGKILGDVVISVDRARIQAKQFNNSLKKELALYVIHGLLHLAGYKDGSRRIEKTQKKLLKGFFK